MEIIVTRRLTLRPPLDVDAEAIARHLQDMRVSRNLTSVPHPYSLEDAHAWIEASRDDDPPAHFTIHREQLIGVVSVRPVGGKVDLGYWLCPSHWGRGYMTEAARAALSRAFRNLDCDAVHSGAYVDNHGSLRVLEKLGFRETGGVAQHFCPTRDEEVPCKRVVLTRKNFDARFGAQRPVAA